ncbi:Protein ENHANCED DISEASE RESISTANCE 2-like [Hondaea fermentalgiana]|uniref:Protein ENHANCED DISEASE RESISTANCE 2-like n=1 Tax=Hondaea fermentalgiana TaxID=2315210 RepID=A0A2R5GEV8_9STRA|nr:Protein ENHANCED DISEASE RESISTANCE 2-like [Hondaea fermentalgiana]|eukprot:GBG29447.1 Protein ENHANCED DISEASE RESISTANCE 2-like [Hondaea fermentalgiana]
MPGSGSAMADLEKDGQGEAHTGLYEGTLLKKPTRLSAYLSWSGWRMRYIVADDDQLQYFGRRGDLTPRGIAVFAHDCKVVNKGKLSDAGLYGFDIVSNGTTWSFASGNAKDVDYWVKVLGHKIRRAVLLRQGNSDLAWRSEWSRRSLLKKLKLQYSDDERPQAQTSFPSQVVPESSADGISSFSDEIDDSFEANAEYGRAPDYFYLARELRIGPDAVTEFEGWRLQLCTKGMRIFELNTEFAGNSATDVNAQIDDLVGAREVRSHAVVSGHPTQVFAMLMDISKSRRAWDPTFVSGTLDEIIDAHNDRLTLEYSCGRGAQCRRFGVSRYWCRESSGTYIISMRASPHAAVTVPDASLEYMFATITPGRAGTSKVVLGLRVALGGWLQFLRPLARSQAVAMVSCLGELKELGEAPPSLRDPVAHSHCIPFACELQDALDEAVLANATLLRDPVALIGVIRELAHTLKDLSDDEREIQRARRLLQQQSQEQQSQKGQAMGPEDKSLTSMEGSSKGQSSSSSSSLSASAVPSGAEANATSISGSINSNGEAETALNYEYGVPKNNFLIPMNISNSGESAWWDSGIEVGFWNVRGPKYLEDRVKVPNQTSAMELVQIQWAFFDQPKRNIARDPEELVQMQHEGRSDRPFMMVINFMVPTIGNYVMYMVKRRTVDYPRFNRMLEKFIAGDDEYRNSRFKIIPNVVSGSYIAKRGIGSTPAILGKKITTEYYQGDNWFEICVDVGSSKVAGSLMGLVKRYAASLVIDLAFLFESQDPDELPEVLMTGCRMHRPLMYPVDNLVEGYTKSAEAYQDALKFPAASSSATAEQSSDEKPADASPGPEENSKEHQGSSQQANGQDGNEGGSADQKAIKQNDKDGSGENDNENQGDEDDEQEGKKSKSEAEVGAENATKEDLNYEYSIPHDNNYLVPMDKSKTQETAVSDSGSLEGYHKVRGPTYLSDGVKVPAEVSAMELVACQWSFYHGAKKHISADKDELIQKQHVGRKDRPFLMVLNFAVPLGGGEGVNMVAYFAKRRGVKDAKFDRMLEKFISADDAYRNSRFKIIPSVPEGYFIARRAIGSKPAILGRKIQTDYYRGDNHFEVCVDVGSSTVAESLMGVVKSYATSMVLDLAFLFESTAEDELPERILGATRFHHPIMFPMDANEFRKTYVKEDEDGSK